MYKEYIFGLHFIIGSGAKFGVTLQPLSFDSYAASLCSSSVSSRIQTRCLNDKRRDKLSFIF